MQKQIEQGTRIIRVKEAAARLGCSVPTHYRKQKTDPNWPRIIKISDRISGCTEESINAFLSDKVAA